MSTYRVLGWLAIVILFLSTTVGTFATSCDCLSGPAQDDCYMYGRDDCGAPVLPDVPTDAPDDPDDPNPNPPTDPNCLNSASDCWDQRCSNCERVTVCCNGKAGGTYGDATCCPGGSGVARSCHPTSTSPGGNASCGPAEYACIDDCGGSGCCANGGAGGAPASAPSSNCSPLTGSDIVPEYQILPAGRLGQTYVDIKNVTCSGSVRFPTWAHPSQNDINWYFGSHKENGTWRVWYDVNNHPADNGTYVPRDIITHVYGFPGSDGTSNGVQLGSRYGTTVSLRDKTCSVAITRTGSNAAQVTYSGNAQVKPGNQLIRLYVERQNGQTISGRTVEYSDGLRNYYLLGTLSSTDAAQSSTTISVTLPPGNYFFHCDSPADAPIANAVGGRCSGNPFCTYEGLGGSLAVNCSYPWKSCSNSDNASFVSFEDPSIRSTDATPTTVAPETGNRNHICQVNNTTGQDLFPLKTNSTREVTFFYPAGAVDNSITSIKVRVGSVVIPMTGSAATGFEGKGSFTNFSPNTYSLEVNFNDSGYISTGRSFRVWDCAVSAQGTIHDNSASPVCPQFGSTVDAAFNFRYTNFQSLSGLADRQINANSASSFASDSSNYLTWGKKYLLSLNNDIDAAQPTGFQVNSRCINSIQLNIDNTVIDPYQSNQNLNFKIGSVKNQENWYQTVGGGVKSRASVNDPVPATCTLASNCTAAVSVAHSGESDNGLLWAPSFNIGIYGKYSYPKNFSITATPNKTIYSFGYLLNEIYFKLGQGTTATSSTAEDVIKNTGIFFIDGDLTITANTTILTPPQFRMIVVKGNLVIEPQVNQVDGIFIVNGSITTSGASNDQLVINGLLYSSNSSINLSRASLTKSLNNTRPTVKVNYRPDFIYNLPSAVTRVISGFQPI